MRKRQRHIFFVLVPVVVSFILCCSFQYSHVFGGLGVFAHTFKALLCCNVSNSTCLPTAETYSVEQKSMWSIVLRNRCAKAKYRQQWCVLFSLFKRHVAAQQRKTFEHSRAREHDVSFRCCPSNIETEIGEICVFHPNRIGLFVCSAHINWIEWNIIGSNGQIVHA